MVNPALRATPEELDRTATVATSISGSLTGLKSKTLTQVDAVMATWTGTAPPAFMGQISSWQQIMDSLIAELNRVSDATRASANHQRTADGDSLSAVNNVQPATALKPF